MKIYYGDGILPSTDHVTLDRVAFEINIGTTLAMEARALREFFHSDGAIPKILCQGHYVLTGQDDVAGKFCVYEERTPRLRHDPKIVEALKLARWDIKDAHALYMNSDYVRSAEARNRARAKIKFARFSLHRHMQRKQVHIVAPRPRLG